VVPCLSMRSWLVGNIADEVQGNLMSGDSLKYIWENKFKKYRFGCFECCKDSCKNKLLIEGDVKVITIKKETDIIGIEEVKKKIDEIHKENPDFPYKNQIVMYAVSPGGNTYVYAVAPPQDCVMTLYGVGTDRDFNVGTTPVYSTISIDNYDTEDIVGQKDSDE
jgi:hypothetical protein